MSQLDEFKKLEQLVKDIYLIADPGVIKFLCCCIISHRLPADPTWSFLVSPPSGGKTELLNCLTKVKGIYPLSSLTPHTFLSGQKRAGKETSLLTRLQNAILTFKDFTTVLSMQPDARNELYGQFREIYDGKMSKEFGTGETKTWKGKISFLAGVTTEIHLARELYSSMGERFALYQTALDAFQARFFAENRSATPPNPQDVADAVASVIAQPAGERALHTVVATVAQRQAPQAVNDAVAYATQSFFEKLRLPEAQRSPGARG